MISASIIDDSASKGITCSRKDSTVATGTWTLNGVEVDCSDTTTGPVRCTRQQPGSVTLYTAGPYDSSGDDVAVPEGDYTHRRSHTWAKGGHGPGNNFNVIMIFITIIMNSFI